MPTSPHGVPQDVTIVEVLADLAQRGFTADFTVDDDGLLCCRVCGVCVSPAAADMRSLRRLEGASDPATWQQCSPSVRCVWKSGDRGGSLRAGGGPRRRRPLGRACPDLSA